MVKQPASVGFATALVACGSWQAAQTFVPALPGSQSRAASQALRGSDPVESQQLNSNTKSSQIEGTALAAAALALGIAGGRAGRSRGSLLIRQAAAVVEQAKEAPPPFNPAKQLGATDPLGFFDPMGFSKVGDEDGFRKLRVAELKHGRVAMMASIGAVFQHFVQFKGFEKIPLGLGAVLSEPGSFGFAALFVVSGLFEVFLWKDAEGTPIRDIGDYGNPLQLGSDLPLGDSVDMKNRELNNGRAAMIAVMGIIVAELATGKDAWQQFG